MIDRIANLESMGATGKRHMGAILADAVTKSNVIGLRKALNAQWRKDRGYSVSRTSPKVAAWEVAELEEALASRKPRVVGELHASGVKLLQSKRYRKRLAPVADIIANLDHFRLVGFEETGNHGGGNVPLYQAVASDGRNFTFRNVPWQSGGDGPELIHDY